MMSFAQKLLDEYSGNCNKGDSIGPETCGPYTCTGSLQGSSNGHCEAVIKVEKQGEKYPVYDTKNKKIIFEYPSLSFLIKKNQ